MTHPAVESVSYPGLQSSPYHELAKKYMSSVNLRNDALLHHEGGYEQAVKFIDGLELAMPCKCWRCQDVSDSPCFNDPSTVSGDKDQPVWSRNGSSIGWP